MPRVQFRLSFSWKLERDVAQAIYGNTTLNTSIDRSNLSINASSTRFVVDHSPNGSLFVEIFPTCSSLSLLRFVMRDHRRRKVFVTGQLNRSTVKAESRNKTTSNFSIPYRNDRFSFDRADRFEADFSLIFSFLSS